MTIRARLDRAFEVSKRGSTLSREVRGGFTTFFTMAYIVVLNPLIIGTQPDVAGKFLGGGAVPNVSLVATATALVAGLLTIAMGAFANFPLALAAGLGLNAFVAFSVASATTWPEAMGLVVLEGALILVLVLTGFREAVFRAVPPHLKSAISCGIGLFLTLIGLVDAGFVRRTSAPPVPVELGIGGSLAGWPTAVFVFGLVVTMVLVLRRVRGALLYGIAAGTALAIAIEKIVGVGPSFLGPGSVNPKGWSLNVPKLPEHVATTPDFSLLGQVDILGAFSRIGTVSAGLIVFTLMLADFFDTMGTVVAVGTEAKLTDDKGHLPSLGRILLVDSLAAMGGGLGSVSSNTSYIESASGVAEGARTGLASIVTGALFLGAIALAPLVAVVPLEAAAPALVVVGLMLMTQIARIDWNDLEVAIPSFFTIVLMPFTYSITVGIGAGFVLTTLVAVARGKARSVHPLLWITSALFVVYFASGPIAQMLRGA
ncbi:MAG: NCS2 family permease [Polyangiaceae bacterium]|nr:NCS2 family permease [Polyangiaceae bacterium]